MQKNSDKFDYLISLAAIKCIDEEVKKLDELDTSDVVFDRSYYRKRNKIIKKSKRASSLKFTKTVMIRVAAAIMVMVMLGCVLIGCVPGLRKAIFDAIVKWYDEYIAVSYDPQDGWEKEPGYQETSAPKNDTELVAPTYIEDVRKPTYRPEGVWEDILLISGTKVDIDYYCNEDYLFSFSQMLLKPNDTHIDNEEVDVTQNKINDNDAMVIQAIYGREISIIWCDGEYSYSIVSTEYDLETLIKYAESVK